MKNFLRLLVLTFSLAFLAAGVNIEASPVSSPDQIIVDIDVGVDFFNDILIIDKSEANYDGIVTEDHLMFPCFMTANDGIKTAIMNSKKMNFRYVYADNLRGINNDFDINPLTITSLSNYKEIENIKERLSVEQIFQNSLAK